MRIIRSLRNSLFLFYVLISVLFYFLDVLQNQGVIQRLFRTEVIPILNTVTYCHVWYNFMTGRALHKYQLSDGIRQHLYMCRTKDSKTNDGILTLKNSIHNGCKMFRTTSL